MIVYDIEIHNAIPDRNGRRETGIKYCEGWKDYGGMGIAVIGCYDYISERSRVFCRDNLREFAALVERHELVVGFNNYRFDDWILRTQGIDLPERKSYDLLDEIWHGAGVTGEYKYETHSGYGLSAMARANFSLEKTGDGALAPIQWQRGAVGTVVDYCLADVHLTKRLLDRVIRAGRLKSPVNETWIDVRKPGGAMYA